MIKLDFILHFLAGFFIAECCQFTGLWMVLIATGAGVLKELWDKYVEKETFDWRDLLMTFGGGFVAYFVERILT